MKKLIFSILAIILCTTVSAQIFPFAPIMKYSPTLDTGGNPAFEILKITPLAAQDTQTIKLVRDSTAFTGEFTSQAETQFRRKYRLLGQIKELNSTANELVDTLNKVIGDDTFEKEMVAKHENRFVGDWEIKAPVGSQQPMTVAKNGAATQLHFDDAGATLFFRFWPESEFGGRLRVLVASGLVASAETIDFYYLRDTPDGGKIYFGELGDGTNLRLKKLP